MSRPPFFAVECGDDSRDGEPAAEESGVRLAIPLVVVEAETLPVGVDVTRSGFEILDAAGEVVAWREHIEQALTAQRERDDGEDVRRVSDGAICATKHRLRRGEHIYSWAWRVSEEGARNE